VTTRMAWIGPEKGLAMRRQCGLAGVSRATVYAQRKPQFVCVVELLLCRLIDEKYDGRTYRDHIKIGTAPSGCM
jgi:putative transposase